MDAIKNPFIAFLFPLIIGIITAFSFHLHLNHFIYLFFLILFFSFLILEKKVFKYNPKYFGVFAYFFVFILGLYVVDINLKERPVIDSDKTYLIEGNIVEQLKIKPKSVQAIVHIESFKDSSKWNNFNTRVLVYFSKDTLLPHLKYGDKIVFKSKLEQIRNTKNPNEFDYETYMQHKGIFYTSFVKSNNVLILQHKQANFFIYAALNIREKLMNIYRRFGIEGQDFAVLSALTLGYRDEVDKETRQKFANTGAMHILAVSGLHVGIIFMILSNLLAFMDKKKYLMLIKSLIIILSLWIFATIAGLSPSVIRSALMFSLFVIGKMLMRTSSIYNIIFASAFVLLILNPFNIFAVGFQLSYAAVLAIVFFQPRIYKLLVFKRWLPDKIWALTTVSIAAQIGTMPIGLYYFHQFPNYFFLSNILVIPLASFILYFAVLLFAVSFVPLLNTAIAFILKVLLKWLIGGVTFIDSLPFATSKDIYISSSQMILIYFIVLSFLFFWVYNKKQILYLFFTSLILFLVIDIRMNYSNYCKNELVIYNIRNTLAINIINDKNFLISEEKYLSDKKIISYSIKPFWLKQRMCSAKIEKIDIDTLLSKDTSVNYIKSFPNAIKIGNISFYLINSSKIMDFQTENRLTVDYIILSQNVYLKINELLDKFNFKELIFDGTNKNWRIEKWKEECKKLGVSYFDISEQGAFGIDVVSGQRLKF